MGTVLADQLAVKAGSFDTGLTESFKVTWSQGTQVASNKTATLPQLTASDSFAMVAETQALSNKTFSTIASYTSHPTFTLDTQMVDKRYVDDAVAGSEMQPSVEDRYDPTTGLTITGCAQLSAMALSGVTLVKTDRWALYGKLYDSTGDRTVELYSDSALTAKVAEGTRTGDGVVTMVEANASGISGTVSVVYTGDDSDWSVRVLPEAQLITNAVVDSVLTAADIQGCELGNTDRWFLYGKVEDVAGDRTVTLYKDAARTVSVATGTRTGDGEVTLAQVSSSGISGTINVAWTADDSDWYITTKRRFLCTASGNTWLNNEIYETDDTVDPVAFRSYIPSVGWSVLVDNEADCIYIFNGTNWTKSGLVDLYWDRAGTVLNPATDGDTMQVGAGTKTAPSYSCETLATHGAYFKADGVYFSVSDTDVGAFTSTGLKLGTAAEYSTEMHGSATLVDNSGPTDVTGLSFAQATYRTYKVEYSIKRQVDGANTYYVTGDLYVWADMGTSDCLDSRRLTAGKDVGVTFTTRIDSGNLIVRSTQTNLGYNATMKFDAKLMLE